MCNACRCRRQKRRGVAAVEAAVVLPVIFLLMFGFIEVGYYTNSAHVVHNAARQGARAAARLENSNAAVQAAVIDRLSNSVDPNAVTVQLFRLDSAGTPLYQITSLDDNEEGHSIQVVVTVDYAQFNPPSNYLGLASQSLSSFAVMQRHE